MTPWNDLRDGVSDAACRNLEVGCLVTGSLHASPWELVIGVIKG